MYHQVRSHIGGVPRKRLARHFAVHCLCRCVLGGRKSKTRVLNANGGLRKSSRYAAVDIFLFVTWQCDLAMGLVVASQPKWADPFEQETQDPQREAQVAAQ